MIGMLKSAKDSAVKARTQAVNQMEGPGGHGPGRASRNARRPDGHRPRCAVQELPSGPSQRSHCGGQVRPSISCLPLPSTRQGDPRSAGRAGTAHTDGRSGPGQHLRSRNRHVGNSADLCRQQPSTHSFRGCLRLVVRGESDARVLRQDQPKTHQL